MKELSLSKRMEAVVKMVSPQSFAIADVGCDHAYVSIALWQRGIAKKVIAMDVRKGPLAIAKSNVLLYSLQDVIELRLGDGLEKLQPDEVDTIVIAGMGGLLMRSILDRGKKVWCKTGDRPVLVLQPQSDIRQLRCYLYENGYCIEKETMLEEDGKFYTVIRAKVSVEGDQSAELDFSEAAWQYGAYNLHNRDSVLLDFLEKENATLQQIRANLINALEQAQKQQRDIPDKTMARIQEVERQIVINADARQYYNVSAHHTMV